MDKIGVSLAGRPIFNNNSWEIQRDQRIRLNGVGKSTLLKIIAQELVEDGGKSFRSLTVGQYVLGQVGYFLL